MSQQYITETNLTQIKIKIDKGTCYFCKKDFENINNYCIYTDDTINICIIKY
mgnify:CR=1 FL=1